MKFFAAIMAVILLIQSFMPCADKKNVSSKGKFQITQSIHHQSDAAQDECPPLCNCTCCGCSTSSLVFISYNLTNFFSILQYRAEYLPAPIQKIALPVWQPPKA